MPLPYLFTAFLYAFVAALAAADASLVSLNFLNSFPALRWIRIHFITLGILSQLIFGMMPPVTAMMSKKPRPAMRWDIWTLLNAGLIALAIGFGGVNHPIIFAGGALVFIAATMLFIQLWGLRGGETSASLKFYLTGVFYLLIGITLGTGLWLNWGGAFYAKIPLEAHIHANAWGFMALVFAGLLIDFLPKVTGQPFGSTRALTTIYYAMTLGALGLVLGPWMGGNKPATIFGLLLHLPSTIWLIALTIQNLKAGGRFAEAGAWHLAGSYLWFIAPILFAPMIMMGVFDGGPIEATAPQPMIYGWVLQFGIALIPFIARKHFLGEKNPQLGGTWLSLICVVLGSVFVWSSIFIVPARGILHGIGFALYVVSIIPPLLQLMEVVKAVEK